MKVYLKTIDSGCAVGKQIVVVDGYGSFHPIYEQLHSLGMMSLYVSHSIKDADVKLCDCLYDVAKHLGVDCDELCNSLPKGWSKEFKFYPQF